jgi:hypothetical protein
MKDFNVLCGMLLIKIDRPDIIGKIVKYNDDLDEFHIVFRDANGLKWRADWGTLLMFKNLGDSWDVIKSSPVIDEMYDS